MRNYEESDSQKALITYCDIKGYPYNMIFSIENEGVKSPQAGKRAKDMGKRPGIPDLCLPVMRGGHGALYIEMKAPKGKLSENQKIVIPKLIKEGYRVEVCYSPNQAIDVIENYLSDIENGE